MFKTTQANQNKTKSYFFLYFFLIGSSVVVSTDQ